MPAALVTGATGLVGSHLVERLARDGWRVRALVRDPERARWLAESGSDLVVGDVLDAERFAAAAVGCDVIFHAAATVTARGFTYEAYRRPNVGGARNAVAAARRAGARLLHVSSVAVYGPTARYDRGPGGTDEEAPLAPLPTAAYYARSKREAEALILDAHRRGEVWATAVRPCVIYGRRDRQFVPRVGRVLRLGVAPLPGSARARLAIVHAANVADGAVRAAGADAAGGRAYNLANDFDLPVADFCRLAGAGLGRRVRLIRFPTPLARAVLALGKLAVTAVRGRGPGFMLDGTVDFLTRDNPFTSERARRELGWAPAVRPADAVPDAFRWWREHH